MVCGGQIYVCVSVVVLSARGNYIITSICDKQQSNTHTHTQSMTELVVEDHIEE